MNILHCFEPVKNDDNDECAFVCVINDSEVSGLFKYEFITVCDIWVVKSILCVKRGTIWVWVHSASEGAMPTLHLLIKIDPRT